MGYLGTLWKIDVGFKGQHHNLTLHPFAGCTSWDTSYPCDFTSGLCFLVGWYVVCVPAVLLLVLLLGCWPPRKRDMTMSLTGSFLPEILQKGEGPSPSWPLPASPQRGFVIAQLEQRWWAWMRHGLAAPRSCLQKRTDVIFNMSVFSRK